AGPGLGQRVDAAPQILNVRAALGLGGRLEGRIQAIGGLQYGIDGDVGVSLLVELDGLGEPALGPVGLLVAPPPHGQRYIAGRSAAMWRHAHPGEDGDGAWSETSCDSKMTQMYDS